MNKIKTIAIAIFLSALTSYANAQVSAGISVTGHQMDPSASETTSSNSRSETLGAIIGTVFVEYQVGPVGIGVEYMPYTIDSETATRVDDQSPVDTGTTTVQVDIENNVGLYATIGLGDGPAYLKIGGSYADLITNESMGATSSSYPNSELIGAHASIGAQFDVNEFFIRTEAGYSQYEDVVVSGRDGDGVANKITVSSLDGPNARISIGKSF